MESQQLFNNIRADFVTEIKPLIFTTSISSIQSVQQIENILKTTKNIVMKSTVQTAINISARNTIEYFLHNSFPDKLDFEHRLYFRAISAAGAAFASTCLLDRHKNIGNLVIYPIWQGAYFGALYMIKNSQESKRFLKMRFPKECKALMENNFTKTTIEFIQGLYSFLNDQGLPYEEQIAKNKDLAKMVQHQMDKNKDVAKMVQKKIEEGKNALKGI